MTTKLFIDTEFNGFGGELISLAIVDENGREFYEAIEMTEPVNEWVAQHVIPFLNWNPISEKWFKHKLYEFLKEYDSDFCIVADWPDDIRYFCQALVTSPGEMMPISTFSTVMIRGLDEVKSEVPHNALHDARAIMKSFQRSYE